ncbi:unnamed protein product [Musa acuminata var. zebrina]
MCPLFPPTSMWPCLTTSPRSRSSTCRLLGRQPHPSSASWEGTTPTTMAPAASSSIPSASPRSPSWFPISKSKSVVYNLDWTMIHTAISSDLKQSLPVYFNRQHQPQLVGDPHLPS